LNTQNKALGALLFPGYNIKQKEKQMRAKREKKNEGNKARYEFYGKYDFVLFSQTVLMIQFKP
jgi:hypothetical protein